jgi:VCBS repeat-containing protein
VALSGSAKSDVASGPGGVLATGAKAPVDAIVVPDAHLLFHADFNRSGVDLVLVDEDRHFVLHDYFKGEKRAALASPDGAYLTGGIVNALAGAVQISQADGSAAGATQVIGRVTKLQGSATATRNGVSITLNNGDNVEKGDVVTSGSASTLGITFIDGTVFVLSSNARMVLDDMIYDPNGSNNSSLLSLVSGTLSFVAGETAKRGNMKIDTPVATMGIRGTAVLVEIDFSIPGPGGTPDAKFQVLVEPDGTVGSYVLFDKLTLQPLSVVNRPGQQINISQGIITQSSDPLSADQQRLILDLFSLKFADLANPNTRNALLNDSIVPRSDGLQLLKFAEAFGLTPGLAGGAAGSAPILLPSDFLSHINQAPTVSVESGTLRGAGIKGTLAIDSVSGKIIFSDINRGDFPTVKVTFDSFSLQDASHHDITSTLTPQQVAQIQAVLKTLLLVADPGNSNQGTVTWTYTVADHDLGFLAPGQTLTLTYLAEVDSNFAPLNLAVITPITITIVGEQLPTIAATSGAITETPGTTNNPAVDHATGTINFGDNDPTVHPVVTAQFASFSYRNAAHVDITSSLSAQQKAAIAAIETALALTPAAGNANNGSVGWSFDVVDGKLDFLAAGEVLTLTYVTSVSDGQGGSASQPVTVTITGTNDIPVLTATGGSVAERPGTGNSTIDHAEGTISFSDADLTDRPEVSAAFSSFTYKSAAGNDITSSLSAGQLAHIAALETSLALAPSPINANNGTVGWSYDVLDSKLDFLASGDVLTLTYTASVNDGHGGLVTEPLTVTLTGARDVPAIVGESDPATQAVIVVSEPQLLGPGVNSNGLGLPTETFDGLPTGALSDNGSGFGDFYSAALNATFSGSGHAGVVNGTAANSVAPFIGPLPHSDPTNYLSIGAHSSETITFASLNNAFGLYWGSADAFNEIDFYNGSTLVGSVSGAPFDNNGGAFSSNRYVEFLNLTPFNKVVLSSGGNSFELDNISAGTADVHSHLAAPVAGSLSVSDADIGAPLTAAVTGNATIDYNGSSTPPANFSFDALTAASAIKFDSVTSNGGTENIDWTYDPVNADLDFLKAGDRLTITYHAQINDGLGSVGSQALTVTIVGADPNSDMANYRVVSGTIQSETFNDVAHGVTIFGGGGQDTFVFRQGFGSATIGDFNVNQNSIVLDHSLFPDVAAILASAAAINAGHDTVITDAAHDTITLVGVTPAQLQLHPNDFHLV